MFTYQLLVQSKSAVAVEFRRRNPQKIFGKYSWSCSYRIRSIILLITGKTAISELTFYQSQWLSIEIIYLGENKFVGIYGPKSGKFGVCLFNAIFKIIIWCSVVDKEY